MIRRLIILLLIVGCEDEPKGACVFLVGVDSLTGLTFSDDINIGELWDFQCEDNYIEEDCCNTGIHPNSSNETKMCNESWLLNTNADYPDSLTPNPTYWINNESCSQYCQEADCD